MYNRTTIMQYLVGWEFFFYSEQQNNHLAGRYSASLWQLGKHCLVKEKRKLQYGEKLWENLGQLDTQWLWLTASQPQTRSALSSPWLKRYVTTSIGSLTLCTGLVLILKGIYMVKMHVWGINPWFSSPHGYLITLLLLLLLYLQGDYMHIGRQECS